MKVYVCIVGNQDSADVCKVYINEEDAKQWRNSVQLYLDLDNKVFELEMEMIRKESQARANEALPPMRERITDILRERFDVDMFGYNYADYKEFEVQ